MCVREGMCVRERLRAWAAAATKVLDLRPRDQFAQRALVRATNIPRTELPERYVCYLTKKCTCFEFKNKKTSLFCN